MHEHVGLQKWSLGRQLLAGTVKLGLQGIGECLGVCSSMRKNWPGKFLGIGDWLVSESELNPNP
ncbi:hypothetical protein I79_020607 [Cricetulus griseus]|uniref:Uncharacterized protein n=1 Tax=Cricetulus griseus TaxID=10029 RepID=G3IAI4_CRIGR|nr:hypothetical protein I79_020607 [Cricetulus griseus]